MLKHTVLWIATSEVVRKLRNIYKRHSLNSIFHISLKHKLPLLLPSTVWKQETGLTFRCSQLNKRKRNLVVTLRCVSCNDSVYKKKESVVTSGLQLSTFSVYQMQTMFQSCNSHRLLVHCIARAELSCF